MARTLLDLTDTFADNSRETWEAMLPGDKNTPKNTPADPEAIAKALAKISKTTLDGIEIQPLYSRDSTKEFMPDSARRAAVSSAPWDIRQIVRTADPATANQQILQELQGGCTSIHLVPQLTTSTSGIALPDPADLDVLLDGVYLELISIGFEPGDSPGDVFEWLFNLAKKRNIDAAELRVSCNIDPFAGATYSASCANADATANNMINLASRFSNEYPQVTTVAADTRPWHNLGANTVQELGIACATCVHHMKVLLASGMNLSAVQNQIVFHLAVDADFFTGIAKLRALRELIAYIYQQFDSDTIPSGSDNISHAYLHAHTSQRMLSRLDADNNQLRNTLACSAAAIGGADCISVEAHHTTEQQDYPLSQPDEFSRRVARNIQMVLQEESNLHQVSDPLGGSPFIESFTSQLVAGAWQEFQEIEKEGGMPAVIQSGSLAKRIEQTRQQRQQQLSCRQSPMVGVSEFASLEQEAFTQSSHQPSVKRSSEPFEALRVASWQYENLQGRKPAVLLLNLGDAKDYRARAGFSQNFLAAAGIITVEFELAEPDKLDTAVKDQLQGDLLSAGSCVLAVCSSDKIYAALNSAFFKALRTAGATRIVLAGRRKALADQSSCDDEIYLGCDSLEKLAAIQTSLEMTETSATAKGSNP